MAKSWIYGFSSDFRFYHFKQVGLYFEAIIQARISNNNYDENIDQKITIYLVVESDFM